MFCTITHDTRNRNMIHRCAEIEPLKGIKRNCLFYGYSRFVFVDVTKCSTVSEERLIIIKSKLIAQIDGRERTCISTYDASERTLRRDVLSKAHKNSIAHALGLYQDTT